MTTDQLPFFEEDDLYGQIASKAGVEDPAEVETVLNAHGINLTTPFPARRELLVRYLYCDGTKAGIADNDGPFTFDACLGSGSWAIASTINDCGKSSLLWALSFALRGEGFSGFVRPATVPWFSYVRADIEVGGVAASVRLTFDRPGRPSVRLLTADSIDELLALEERQEEAPGVRVAAAAGPNGTKALIDRFMLERLGLRPLSVWRAEPGAPKDADGNRDSVEDIHRWASFFYAVALNSANDSVLLGPTTTGQLPVRLMQIFLDVPYVAELTQLTTAGRKDAQEDHRVARRAREDETARQEQTEPLRHALSTAEDRLGALQADQPDLAGLLEAVDATAGRVAASLSAHQAAQERHGDARKARLTDKRRARRAAQSSAARLLLGALDPEACPRCDHSIEEDRKEAEDTQHLCSMCTNPLPGIQEDPEARAQAMKKLEDRVAASSKAEQTADASVQAAAAELDANRAAHQQAQERLRHAQSSQWHAAIEDAQRKVYELRGALGVATRSIGAIAPAVDAYLTANTTATRRQPDPDAAILAAAAEVLTQTVAVRSRALFGELNDEIVTMAQKLGVRDLTSVSLGLNGNVNAKKSGSKHRFSAFSPTERLRIRIATVVAMISVCRRHGIMSHPGLLLIDAPTAEELAPEYVKLALQTLYDAGAMPGMQVIITSLEKEVWDIFPEGRIVTGPHKRELF
ncbi:hypothetical protein [Streptomyces goshikiensis]|uniref:hypothetical protein n=1 Tax=Streptomyces goshikiensis TaxID=1942 RepID=UPI002ADFE606|nr:hypothetical protein [Streptomyces goshikiensis]